MIGMILGDRYELLEKIGEGGMSEVYKAKCHKLNRFDAVKILKKEFSSDEEVVEKFKREATAVANLSDNNIVNIYDVGSQNDIHYIVMEYVKGKTLKEIIRQEFRLNYEKVLDYAIQIGKALECAHRNNIIHRDVKPQNILVTQEGVVKVTDFGIAKAPTSVTITNTNRVMGSAHYFSPEQAKGNIVDFRTDIYSLGIVLYEMATGKVPYDAESPVSVALKHIQDPIIPPKQINSAIPESLNKLIVKAIEKDPNMRYQSIKEMMTDVYRIQKDVNADIVQNNVEEEFTRVMSPINVKSEDSSEEVEKRNEDKKVSKKTKSILIISLCAILVITLGSLLGWAASRTINPNSKKTEGSISVPEVTGKPQAEAKKAIEDAGLRYEVLDTIPSEMPKDSIAETSPKAGESVNKGSTIRVRISSGLETYLIKDLKNLDLATAKNVLIKSGFKEENITVSEDYSDTIEANMVMNQKPSPNEKGDKNTKIQLTVSKGPQFVKVPSLFGKSSAEAENIILNAKLVLDKKIEVTTNNKDEDGKVIAQSIEKDTQIKPGQSISISIGKYEAKKVTIPDFKNKTGADYRNALLSLSGKLNIAIGGGSETNKVKSVTVNSKSLNPGDTIEENSSVVIITEADIKVSPTPSSTPTVTPTPSSTSGIR